MHAAAHTFTLHCDHLKIPVSSSGWPQGLAGCRKNEKIKIEICIRAFHPESQLPQFSPESFPNLLPPPTP